MPIDYPGDDDFPANVRLKATTDPATGGVDQGANFGIQDNADRTAYLQARRFDDYRIAVESASGGRATVMQDNLGNWHLMARIPAFQSESFDADLAYDGGAQLHPAFRLPSDMVPINMPEIYVGIVPVSLNADDELITVPGTVPDTAKTYDEARAACAALGTGWHLLTLHEWGALAFWAYNLIADLRGNTSANDITDQEYGLKAAVSDDQILSGSGPLAWRHDGRCLGVADLVGQNEEYVHLYQVVDGLMKFPLFNEWWMNPADFPTRLIYWSQDVGDNLNIDGLQLINTFLRTRAFSSIEHGANFTPESLPSALTQPYLPELLLNRTWYTDGPVPTPHTIAWLAAKIGDITAVLESGTKYGVRGGMFDDGADAGLPTLRHVTAASTGSQYRVAWMNYIPVL